MMIIYRIMNDPRNSSPICVLPLRLWSAKDARDLKARAHFAALIKFLLSPLAGMNDITHNLALVNSARVHPARATGISFCDIVVNVITTMSGRT